MPGDLWGTGLFPSPERRLCLGYPEAESENDLGYRP